MNTSFLLAGTGGNRYISPVAAFLPGQPSGRTEGLRRCSHPWVLLFNSDHQKPSRFGRTTCGFPLFQSISASTHTYVLNKPYSAMGVTKLYTYNDVKAAIEIADRYFYRTKLRVRSDVSVEDWGKSKIKVPRDSSGNPVNPLQWRGRGSDVGHSFRHVEGTAPAGKSTYRDYDTMIQVTMEVLNSAKGQAQLAKLDSLNPLGDEVGMEHNLRIQAPVTKTFYGFPSNSNTEKIIKTAVCEVMKLGASQLWIHSTYPKHFR